MRLLRGNACISGAQRLFRVAVRITLSTATWASEIEYKEVKVTLEHLIVDVIMQFWIKFGSLFFFLILDRDAAPTQLAAGQHSTAHTAAQRHVLERIANLHVESRHIKTIYQTDIPSLPRIYPSTNSLVWPCPTVESPTPLLPRRNPTDRAPLKVTIDPDIPRCLIGNRTLVRAAAVWPAGSLPVIAPHLSPFLPDSCCNYHLPRLSTGLEKREGKGREALHALAAAAAAAAANCMHALARSPDRRVLPGRGGGAGLETLPGPPYEWSPLSGIGCCTLDGGLDGSGWVMPMQCRD